jgi:hypothetical protein
VSHINPVYTLNINFLKTYCHPVYVEFFKVLFTLRVYWLKFYVYSLWYAYYIPCASHWLQILP